MNRTKNLRLALGIFTSIALVLLLLPGSAAEAGNVLEPETVVEAPVCDGESFKIEDPREGRYVDGPFIVELTIRETEDGQVFDWSSNLGVDMVVVKGGPTANVYTYDSATGDEGLHAPYNSNSEGWYELSHILFCYEVTEPTTSTTVAPTTTTAAPTTTVEPTTTTVAPTTSATQSGTSTTRGEDTSSTTTTIPTEVLPTQVVNTTVSAGVLPTGASTSTTVATEVLAGELPYTGLSGSRLTALGLALLGAGITLMLIQKQSGESE